MIDEFSKIKNLEAFDNHKFVSFINDDKTNLRGFIAVHRGNTKFPAFGATRIWDYPNEKDALIDALRLSKTMSHKAALAGLNCGGAKAVIYTKESEIRERRLFLKSYTSKVNYLSGHFVTGADVGVSREDVITMRRYSPYIVGVMTDPVRFTALGLLLTIECCLKEVFGSESLTDRSFAIQGVGKIGSSLLKLIYPYTKNIFIADINGNAIQDVKLKYPEVKVVDPSDIHKQNVDVFSPCALSNCLNKNSVNELRCKIVAGGANNQLENDYIAEIIYKMNILYAPDYVANAGGLISVYDEYEYGNYRINRVKNRVKIVKKNIQEIIKQSKKKKVNTAKVADTLAREIFDNLV